MRGKWTGRSGKNGFRKDNSGHRRTLIFCLSTLFAVGLLTELYLFPEILAPDCIRIVTEEETGSEEGRTETDKGTEKEEPPHEGLEETMDAVRSAFRFYESPYRIAWKFF